MTLAIGDILVSRNGLLVRVVRVRGGGVEVLGRSWYGYGYRRVLIAAQLGTADDACGWTVVE